MTDADIICLFLTDRYCFHLDPNALMRTCHCSVQSGRLQSADVRPSKANEYALCLFVEFAVDIAVFDVFRFFQMLLGGRHVEVRSVILQHALAQDSAAGHHFSSM